MSLYRDMNNGSYYSTHHMLSNTSVGFGDFVLRAGERMRQIAERDQMVAAYARDTLHCPSIQMLVGNYNVVNNVYPNLDTTIISDMETGERVAEFRIERIEGRTFIGAVFGNEKNDG